MKKGQIVRLILGMGLGIFLASCSNTASQEINVLCSPQLEWCEGMKAEFEAKFKIKVTFVQMSSGESLTRLRDEKAAPQFDVWWGGPIDSYMVGKQEGLFTAYDSPNFANLVDPTKTKDPDNFWVGVYRGGLAICTSKTWLAAHPETPPPQTWADLLKPEFKGHIMMAHPSTSGTAYTFISTILQLQGQEAGWAYLHQFGEQVSQFTKSGVLPCQLVAKGEAIVGLVFAQAVIHDTETGKLPLVLTFPTEGTGYEIGGMAIINGAKHLDAAKIWVDWALTAETQSHYAKYNAYPLPTVKEVKIVYPQMLTAKLMDYDFASAAQHKNEVVDKFTQEIATADNLRQ